MCTWLTLSTISDIAQLKDHIAGEYDPANVAKKLVSAISTAVKAVLIEPNYVDKDYRSTFYHFYSKKGQRYRPDCVRLHFFDDSVSFDSTTLRLSCSDQRLTDHYFGYMVLRPTGIATIGRTVVSPDVRSGASRFVITAEHKVHILGYKLTVQGFPSMDQHIDISVCAHVACWSILRHYSERYNLYREFLTHDITLMAQEFDPGGLVPSKGLQVSHAERVFQHAGTFPVHIAKAKTGSDPQFYRQLCAYVESGFPLFAAMHGKSHAIAVIGYDWRQPTARAKPELRYSWDEIQSLCAVDDNHLPYLSVPSTSGGTPAYSAQDIDAFIVALPEKVFYPADAVDRLAQQLLNLGSLVGLPPADETIIRYCVATGAGIRKFVRQHESEFDPKLVKIIMTLPFAQFVWIVEYATDEQWAAHQVAGRAIIDATASLHEPLPIWLFHNRSSALLSERKTPGELGLMALQLADVGHSGFSRMDQNLRPTQTK